MISGVLVQGLWIEVTLFSLWQGSVLTTARGFTLIPTRQRLLMDVLLGSRAINHTRMALFTGPADCTTVELIGLCSAPQM